MSFRKVKSAPKFFVSDKKRIEKIVVSTMEKVADIVGSSLGPGGRPSIIESELPDLPNRITKDGVTIFKSLGSYDPIEQLIIEAARDASIRTANEAGDGPVPASSKVLTPYGWKTMKDIKIGDVICGTDRTQQFVLGVFPKGQKEIYKVHFQGKACVECCEDHLWEVTDNTGKTGVFALKTILNDYKLNDKNTKSSFKYSVRTTEVDFEETESMPIDPYLLGVLLGDGSLSGTHRSTIEISLGKKKEHVLSKLKLPEGIKSRATWNIHKNYFRVKLTGESNDGLSMRGIVNKVGLLGTTSSTKFIPKQYLYSSFESRKQLLQGLLDTDGHVKPSGLFEFSTISEQLCNDILELCRGLGIFVSVREKDRTNCGGYSTTKLFVINQRRGSKYGNQITEIEKTGVFTEMLCIKVSNSNSLYVINDYVVTHNTTTATILSGSLIKSLFSFCSNNKSYSPQKAMRIIQKCVKEELLPFIESKSIKIGQENKGLLEKVATISANGDTEMAKAVIEAYETVGYGAGSHITIQELSGPQKYEVELIEGFPIPMGYEDSCGKFHTSFINDQANQRCLLTKPLFLLYDGTVSDLVMFQSVFEQLDKEYQSGNSDFKNIVLVAHGFSESVLTMLAVNFKEPTTLNILPLVTPMTSQVNSRYHFLYDFAAFTGAKVFDMTNHPSDAKPKDFGYGNELFECYRFRSTLVGDPDPVNVEVRAEEIKGQIANPASQIEKILLEERLGKLTNGIAKLKIFGASDGELKEKHDRVEDAVCAVRNALNEGCLPGGCRIGIDMILYLASKYDKEHVVNQVLVAALFAPIAKLLDNVGYNEEEVKEVVNKLMKKPNLVYDVSEQKFGKAEDLGLFDAAGAVSKSLENAVSVAGVLGTLGGIVGFPRDDQNELQAAKEQRNYDQSISNPEYGPNPANERP